MISILSLGAGVQSTALALMATRGVIAAEPIWVHPIIVAVSVDVPAVLS